MEQKNKYVDRKTLETENAKYKKDFDSLQRVVHEYSAQNTILEEKLIKCKFSKFFLSIIMLGIGFMLSFILNDNNEETRCSDFSQTNIKITKVVRNLANKDKYYLNNDTYFLGRKGKFKVGDKVKVSKY